MKKILSVLLVAVMLVSVLTACSKKQEGSGGEKSGDVFKVAWITMVNDSWHNQTSTLGKKYLEEHGDNVEVTIMDNKNWDEAETGTLLDQIALAGDYSLVIVGTMSDRTEIVRQLQENGTNVILTTNDYPWAKDLASVFRVNEYDLASIVAKAAVDEIPEGAGVVLLRGLQGYYGSEERGRAFHDALAARTDITILDEQFAGFDKAKAMAVTDDWITAYGDKITCVLSESDVMALGAIEALNAAGRTKDDVYVYGIDGLYEGCEAVKDGIIRATSYQDSQKYIEAYADRVAKLQSGEIDSTYVEDAIIEPTFINSSNVDEFINFYKTNGFDK